jgi:hypothetical protein
MILSGYVNPQIAKDILQKQLELRSTKPHKYIIQCIDLIPDTLDEKLVKFQVDSVHSVIAADFRSVTSVIMDLVYRKHQRLFADLPEG